MQLTLSKSALTPEKTSRDEVELMRQFAGHAVKARRRGALPPQTRTTPQNRRETADLGQRVLRNWSSMGRVAELQVVKNQLWVVKVIEGVQ